MTRKIKALGLALVALATMVAVTAPAAHAETGALTAVENPATVTGEQLPGMTFDIGAGFVRTVSCATSDLNATIVGPTDPVTFKPIYAGCISEPGGFPATVTTNGCDYNVGFTRPGSTGTPQTTGTMQARLLCPAGQRLEIHVYQSAAAHAANVSTCTYDVVPQGPVPAGVYHNNPGPPADVLATIDASFNGLNTLGPMFICGANAGENVPVTLTGQYTLRGYTDFGFVEGPQIPLHVG